MRYRKEDENGDMVFGRGLNSYETDSPQAVGLAVKNRLALYVGEWFLDPQEGTQLIPGILGKTTKEAADYILKERISGTEGVLEIAEFESTADTEYRRYAATAAINTVYGQTTIIKTLSREDIYG